MVAYRSPYSICSWFMTRPIGSKVIRSRKRFRSVPRSSEGAVSSPFRPSQTPARAARGPSSPGDGSVISSSSLSAGGTEEPCAPPRLVAGSLEAAHRLLLPIIHGEDGGEARDLEHLLDVGLEAGEHDPAVQRLEPLGGDEQHAQPSAADVIQVFHVHDQVLLTDLDQREQLLLEPGGRAGVQLAVQPQSRDGAALVLRHFHGSPLRVRPTRSFS